MKLRGFEKIAKYADVDFQMPERKTQKSAGYDFCLPEDVVLEPGKLQLVPTGVKAYTPEAEWRQIERDIKLADETKVKYHVCHVSTKESISLIRDAKKSGVNRKTSCW